MEPNEQKTTAPEQGPVLRIGMPAAAVCTALFVGSLTVLGAGFWLLSAAGHQLASNARLETELLQCQLEQRDLQGRLGTFQLLFIEARKPVLREAVDQFERRTRNREAAAALRLWLEDPAGEPPMPVVQRTAVGGPLR